jgi:hypothetical protein
MDLHSPEKKPYFLFVFFFVSLCHRFALPQCNLYAKGFHRMCGFKIYSRKQHLDRIYRIVVILSLGTWPTRTNLHDPFPTQPFDRTYRIEVIPSLGTWPTRTNLHDPFPTQPVPLPLTPFVDLGFGAR